MTDRNQQLLRHFNVPTSTLYWSDKHEEYAERLRAAVQSRRLLAVIGRFGSGKSVLAREALRRSEAQPVYVNNPDRERLRISHVVTALIAKLSDERPRQDMIARTHQLARIMGEKVVLEGAEIVVVIENAHRMHANTLLALKDLRESAIYKGESPLFTALLVGQEALYGKIEKWGEVKYRTKPIMLTEDAGWMDYPERLRYLETIYGDLIGADTRDRIAAMHESPLEMDHFIEGKLEQMKNAGIARMTTDQVPLSIRAKREAAGFSLRDVERKTAQNGERVAPSTASDVEQGKNQNEETARRLESAIDDLIDENKNSDLRPVS